MAPIVQSASGGQVYSTPQLIQDLSGAYLQAAGELHQVCTQAIEHLDPIVLANNPKDLVALIKVSGELTKLGLVLGGIVSG